MACTFFEGCIAVEWAGVQQTLALARTTKHRQTLGDVAGCQLWEITRGTRIIAIRSKHNGAAQDLARRDAILLAVVPNMRFGRSGLPP
jgi:hypothetical protein